MIPYDELVVALQAWRAKRGLPVGQLSGALVPPPPAATARAAPPAPPRAPSASSLTTQPGIEPVTDNYHGVAEAHVESEQEVEALGEHEYANEGDDFAMAFQNLEAEGESTAIGSAPAPSASQTQQQQRRRNDDW